MQENNKFLFKIGILKNLKLQRAELSISASTCVITLSDLLYLGLKELLKEWELLLEIERLTEGLPSNGEGMLTFYLGTNYLLYLIL